MFAHLHLKVSHPEQAQVLAGVADPCCEGSAVVMISCSMSKQCAVCHSLSGPDLNTERSIRTSSIEGRCSSRDQHVIDRVYFRVFSPVCNMRSNEGVKYHVEFLYSKIQCTGTHVDLPSVDLRLIDVLV